MMIRSARLRSRVAVMERTSPVISPKSERISTPEKASAITAA